MKTQQERVERERRAQHEKIEREKKEHQERIEREKREIPESVKNIIRSHAGTLHVKKLQKVSKDDYGNVLDAPWLKEKEYFYDKVIIPQLIETYGGEKLTKIDLTETKIQGELAEYTVWTDHLIELITFEYSESHPADTLDIDRFTPLEFEAYCAQQLKENGWSARVTRGSGDQGIDIIGEKDGYKAVFQVKKYSSPVGNKAVQEVIAGKAFASADLAYVVSNADFTPSARTLANKSGVQLLHYSQLSTLSPIRTE